MSKIIVTLTAANMGNVDETDFDLWTKFVSENHEGALGFEIAEIDQHRFSGGPDRDTIHGGTEEDREAIRTWLAVTGWDTFCGEVWETMRREYDAANEAA
jgi:hypothetical protein